MWRRSCLLFGLVLAGFALGVWFTKATAGRAETKGRVFELRTYTASEGKLEALQTRFRQHTTRLFEKHGMTNIGYWVPRDAPGSQNTLIYILAHPSREAARKSWDAFRNDPDWKKARDESEANGRLTSKVESVFMDPTDYSSLK